MGSLTSARGGSFGPRPGDNATSLRPQYRLLEEENNVLRRAAANLLRDVPKAGHGVRSRCDGRYESVPCARIVC